MDIWWSYWENHCNCSDWLHLDNDDDYFYPREEWAKLSGAKKLAVIQKRNTKRTSLMQEVTSLKQQLAAIEQAKTDCEANGTAEAASQAESKMEECTTSTVGHVLGGQAEVKHLKSKKWLFCFLF